MAKRRETFDDQPPGRSLMRPGGNSIEKVGEGSRFGSVAPNATARANSSGSLLSLEVAWTDSRDDMARFALKIEGCQILIDRRP